ncbi:hypothetical protein LOAG_13179 [Loa loa]|uniref:Secreted protein n=1 Tax=Loa loa TaxID=7209 RepID=A0A1S0TKZ0_LOALO|nr:hypothetical protein LOAG_13179 [Loa loa]EFO15334.1 hypothetical protein LOAG_13179 [Loa loa]
MKASGKIFHRFSSTCILLRFLSVCPPYVGLPKSKCTGGQHYTKTMDNDIHCTYVMDNPKEQPYLHDGLGGAYKTPP